MTRDRASSPAVSQFAASLALSARELWSTYVILGLLFVTTIGWLMMVFAMNLDVVEGSVAALRIFGVESTPTTGSRDPDSGEWVSQALDLDRFVIGIQQFVAGASYLLGTFLGLFAAAPLATALVEAGRIDLLLSKPLTRIRLLAGHVAGVTLVMAALAAYLVGAVWIVLALKTGIWDAAFLWVLPIMIVMFMVMYSIVLLLVVTVRSTPVGLITAYGLIFLSLILTAHDQIVPQLTGAGRVAFGVLYDVLPNFIEGIVVMGQLIESHTVESLRPLVSSIFFGAAVYALAAWRFARRDF